MNRVLGYLRGRYDPEKASWHASKPVYWLFAYLYNTNSDSDGYLRYRPGEFEVIEVKEEVTERDLGQAESIFAILPSLVYITGIAVVSNLVSGGIGLLPVLVLAVLAILTLDQLGNIEVSVSMRTDTERMEMEQ